MGATLEAEKFVEVTTLLLPPPSGSNGSTIFVSHFSYPKAYNFSRQDGKRPVERAGGLLTCDASYMT